MTYPFPKLSIVFLMEKQTIMSLERKCMDMVIISLHV